MTTGREWHRRQAKDRRRLPLVSRRVALEPLAMRHIDGIRSILAKEAMEDRWPVTQLDVQSPDLDRRLWAFGGLQYAVVRRDTSATVGLVQGVFGEPRGGTIGVGVVIDPAHWRAGWPFEAIVVFIDLLFATFGYRKIYLQVAESTLTHMGPFLDRFLVKEATYRAHRRSPDGYEDWHVYALFASKWDHRFAESLLDRAV